MLEKLDYTCRRLKNWFTRNQYVGEFTIEDGELRLQYDDGQNFCPINVKEGQYIRIINSALNDGVYRYPALLEDEVFSGGVWIMSPDKTVLSILNEADEWEAKYGGADGAANSPYQQESFGNYSRTLKTGGDVDQYIPAWWREYGKQLWQWRKL